MSKLIWCLKVLWLLFGFLLSTFLSGLIILTGLILVYAPVFFVILMIICAFGYRGLNLGLVLVGFLLEPLLLISDIPLDDSSTLQYFIIPITLIGLYGAAMLILGLYRIEFNLNKTQSWLTYSYLFGVGAGFIYLLIIMHQVGFKDSWIVFLMYIKSYFS